MRKIFLQILSLFIILLMVACQPATCINCGKPNKPAYYNKERAKETSKMMRQNNRSTATGGKTDFDPSAKEKKTKEEKKKTKGNETDNPPKL
jgi:hypothetical protein